MNAIIVGGSGGIGAALTRCLAQTCNVHAIARNEIAPAINLKTYQADILDENQLFRVSQKIVAEAKPTLVIVATGILSDAAFLKPEKTYRSQSLESFERLFRVNTIGPALVAKHFLPIMPRKGRTVFAVLSARVGSISDNRSGGWHAYRASKAALNMLIRNYAIEQAVLNHQSIVVGLHPGTVDTDLSLPFQKNLPKEQIISAETSAKALLRVLDKLSVLDTGKVFDWRGEEIPY